MEDKRQLSSNLVEDKRQLSSNLVEDKRQLPSNLVEEKDLQSAIEIVSKLDYPNEIVYHGMISKPRDLTIIDQHKKTILENLPYSFLTNLSYNFRKKMKKLGLIVIDVEELNACNTITSSYSLSVRIHSRRHDVPLSCYDYWTKNRDEVLKIASIQLIKHIDLYIPNQLPPATAAIENECAIALFKTGIPGCFPSTLVTFMIDELSKRPEFKTFTDNIKTKKVHMLDISAGWGDRLLAACSRGYLYTGCDPNTAMQDCYDNIYNNHGVLWDSDELGNYCDSQIVICSPFEDWDGNWKECKESRKGIPSIGKIPPNFMISSPPFFNLEIYSNESTQSSERYPKIHDWIEKFLKPSLKKASDILAPNSPVVLHLSDVIDFKDSNRSIIFVEKIIDWCVNQLGWVFIGNYGFTIRDSRKESETREDRKEKDEVKLNPKGVIKKYDNGLRCNAKGEYFSQPLWVFRK
jgi:hypothetical protein